MKLISSDIYGEVKKPASFNDLIKLVSNLENGEVPRMWRGQGDISWPIHSSAYRKI